ncbi:hypothetical protein GLOIN_2v808918 [Rhizophagus irregularis DAOM 181602=DAOM 197198]|uniref:Uncharacterized protein n=1 Tax=Rhizophagus irregularis (strain DAOM 181602 / DAOM 197198 / MUCL 43194) TaxID=747089 RepID=A0A2P4P3Y2_RHIID|nr:hypothetical protein GLOIN_2v808918 [Rhizophagus irregularis DAOM 181602=DAOM 197198]POG60087.1 hypothetical protein GLOIN_2v808918 [Rhizophagus irregularis DAOM 181602=DAOM 197198]|eukprot:XP_025166953.1 hypothetical protein GLOIN_2v808918 [Rhizophagus irregularis DAOM 181602=DAOM 197198]
MPSVKNAFYDIIWKINIKKIISSDCFIKFIVERKCSFINKSKKEYVLQYEDILELEGLGWISYVTFCPIYLHGYDQIQLSIVTQEDSIDMVCNFVLILSICTEYMNYNIIIPLFIIANRICQTYLQSS